MLNYCFSISDLIFIKWSKLLNNLEVETSFWILFCCAVFLFNNKIHFCGKSCLGHYYILCLELKVVSSNSILPKKRKLDYKITVLAELVVVEPIDAIKMNSLSQWKIIKIRNVYFNYKRQHPNVKEGRFSIDISVHKRFPSFIIIIIIYLLCSWLF